MWYFIIALIFLALEIATVAVLVRVDYKKRGRGIDLDDVFENFFPLLLVLSIGAVVWPLLTLIIVLVVIFNLFLKEPFENLTDWLSEKL